MAEVSQWPRIPPSVDALLCQKQRRGSGEGDDKRGPRVLLSVTHVKERGTGCEPGPKACAQVRARLLGQRQC